ncbi:elongation factor Ts, mitochondrial [Cyathus striatus]|nr:elongation factor Ts, mitochondrial [Cyathus striatus]
MFSAPRFLSRHQLPVLARSYASPPAKASVKLVAELRKLTEVSITKAREALAATNNDVKAALEWLEEDLAVTGEKKAEKVGGRPTSEGLIAVSVLSRGAGAKYGAGLGGVRAAMIELNCETDFVGRNELFGRLAADIAHTAAYISEPSQSAFQPCSLDSLKDAPLLSHHDPSTAPSGTVSSSIRDLIAKVGENVTLRRAVAVIENAPKSNTNLALRLGSYIHGAVNQPTQGRMGALALTAFNSKNIATLLASEAFRSNLDRLERSLARQIVGFDTQSISGPSGDEAALYNQPFMMFPGEDNGKPVQEVLHNWAKKNGLADESDNTAVAVLDFAKWTVGESLESNGNSQN